MSAPLQMHPTGAQTVHPKPGEAFRFWLKLGFISFGGPAAQIAIMHQELVERRRWISEERFIHALNFCMLLPGPEAQQLATYTGWMLHGTRGGVVAGTLFVLPSAILLFALSWIYVCHGATAWMMALLYGLKPAVLAIVIAAVWRMGRRVLKTPAMVCVAAGAFLALATLKAPFPAVILVAAMVGAFIGTKPGLVFSSAQSTTSPQTHSPSAGSFLKVLGLWGAIWWLPILGAGTMLGSHSTTFRQGVFFSKAAMITFGGAYAVLPYVSRYAVDSQWLSDSQTIDGLGLAETTPGPLIMVLQFVGFLGGWNQPGALRPIAAASLGALITTWATFTPCFLWIFLCAPYVDRLRQNRHLNAALAGVSAAVVGVILNLAVWFGWHALVPDAAIDLWAAAVTVAVLVGLERWNWNVSAVVVGAALLGLVEQSIFRQL